MENCKVNEHVDYVEKCSPEIMNIHYKNLYDDDIDVSPFRAHYGDAGADLRAHSVEVDEENGQIVIGSGIAVEIPVGYVGLVFPRSSIYKTGLTLTNCVGVIDSGYRGEIKARFAIQKEGGNVYKVGERFAQLLIVPVQLAVFDRVEELKDSERGDNGYGSSGR